MIFVKLMTVKLVNVAEDILENVDIGMNMEDASFQTFAPLSTNLLTLLKEMIILRRN